MKSLLLAASLLVLAAATPLPQQVEQDAEVFTPPVRNIPARDRDTVDRHFIRVRPFSLDDLFGTRDRNVPAMFRPFIINRRVQPSTDRDPIFGSPSFVDVPASGGDPEENPVQNPEPSTPTGAEETPFHRVFEDMLNLQRDLLSGILGSSSQGRNPSIFTQGQNPSITADSKPEFIPTVERIPVNPPPRRTSFLDSLFPGMFGGGSDMFGPPRQNPFGFPGLSDFPAEYDNTTYREEEIDGKKVRVNETIKRHSTPFGTSVFHFKVYSLHPDGTEETIEDVEIPESVGEDVPQFPESVGEDVPRFPESVGVDIPQVPVDIPQVPVETFKEDFGSVVPKGNGNEEPSIQIPGFDESVNEIVRRP